MERDTENSPVDLDLAALACAYLDRGLDDAQLMALNDRLRSDRESRAQFVQCMLNWVELEELLPEEHSVESLRPSAGPGRTRVSQDCPVKQPAAPGMVPTKDADPKPRSVGMSFLNTVFTADNGGINAPLFLGAIAVAMLLGAVLAISAKQLAGSSARRSSGTLVAEQDGDFPQALASPAITVNVTNCLWDKSRSTADLAEGKLKPGQSLHLLEGVAEIKSTLPSGSIGEFRLEGPLALTLSDDGMPNLLYGKLSGEFRYHEDAFRLGTALGRVVVLGDASIGIKAAANEVELHVFSGAAVLDLWSTSTTAVPNQLLKVEPGSSLRVRITADGELSIDRGEASENRFVTSASLAASQLQISDQYVNAVRAAKPVGYWRFEEEDAGGVLRNEMSDRFQLRMGGGAVRLRSRQGTCCAEFGFAAGPGYLMSEDVLDDVIDDDFSVELWAKPTCFHHGAIFSLIDWTPEVNPRGRHRVYLEFCGPRNWDYLNSGGLLQSDPGRMLFITNRTEKFSKSPYAVRKWQHLVALRDGATMRLYADGRLIVADKNSEPLGSGLRILIGQLYPPTRFLRDEVTARLYSGELDEVALYNRPLTEAEIQEHVKFVTPDAGSTLSETKPER